MYLLIVFITTICSIAALYPLSTRLMLVDKPGGRKQHDAVVPMIGGLGILAGCIFGFSAGPTPLFSKAALLLISAALALLGVLDDRHELRASSRLLLQFLLVFALILITGTQIHTLGELVSPNLVELHRFSIPLTVIAISGVINAFNMIDGIDGLLGTTSLLILLALFTLASKAGLNFELGFIATLIAAVLGFLVFNFPNKITHKRRVFLGDAGSMLLGLYVAWLGVRLTQAPLAAAQPITIVWFLALPLLDFSQVCIHRFSQGRSPLAAGRDHVHHLIMQLGFSAKQTLYILAGFTGLCCSLGLLAEYLQVPDYYRFYAFLSLGVVYHIGIIMMRRKDVGPRPQPTVQ